MLQLTGIMWNGQQRGPWTVPANIEQLLNKVIIKYDLPASFIYGLCAGESSFRADAENNNPPTEDSLGLFQWNSLAHIQYSRAQLFDAAFNAEITGAYISQNAHGSDWHGATSIWGARPLAELLWQQWDHDGTSDQISASVHATAGAGGSSAAAAPVNTMPAQPAPGDSGQGANPAPVPLIPGVAGVTSQKFFGLSWPIVGFVGLMVGFYIIHNNEKESNENIFGL